MFKELCYQKKKKNQILYGIWVGFLNEKIGTLEKY